MRWKLFFINLLFSITLMLIILLVAIWMDKGQSPVMEDKDGNSSLYK